MPPTRLPRSPSDPIHLSHRPPSPSPGPAAGQQIYVLTADGSSLFLVDPSKPRGGEEPPPYASFPVQPLPLAGGDDAEADADVDVEAEEPGVGVRRVEFPRVHEEEEGPHRHRARTLSAISNQERYRPRTFTFTRPPASRRARSALSTPEPRTAWLVDVPDVPDETTPLLPGPGRDLESAPIIAAADEQAGWRGRGWWKGVWCGELEDGEEDTRVGWGEGWKRYWRPALLVWPWLLVGTLAGTALLITLPLGAIVWWLTLIISRSAARLETIMQLHYHTPLPPGKTAQYHPIFYRPLPVPRSSSPYYNPLPSPSSHPHPHPHPYHTTPSSPLPPTSDPSPIIWDKRFTKNAYAMFLDHYSYSALSYFLLIKPLLTLFGTIMCILVLAVLGVGTLGVGLPVGMRIVRRWGRWQGEVALDNL
ncbi:hypothetical protein L198_02848 [Cryptococcus wingfieldii CBS 7118]|uniref:Uncharacterized protein n=1 Tax=Cryptococcus wingfieldii CBS 7118 TaxID=1295528 RepID=A0A1E3JI11_9TREE|nr:hypothetical protein L198_02848 [Cryptococcus wingfieldii CBS 7118]ODO00529.1 hypothetical protein L198_02848 [Cryptococcus wingfieldii CBS 7118]